MKKEDGFIEFNAVLVLFFIAAVVTGSVLYASASINYTRADTRDFDEKTSAILLLDEIIEKMQMLSGFSYDNTHNALLSSLCSEYNNINLSFTDVSSGFNLNFISDINLADSSIARILFLDNTGNTFVSWRNANGLTNNKENWRTFLKEDAFVHCASYGFLHIDDTESFGYRNISSSFSALDSEKLFPLVNNFPRMNVNMVNPEILRPLVMRNTFRIERPQEKANTLINRLKNESLSHSEIASILRVTVNHPLMGYLGTKTSFWKIEFSFSDFLKVEAIVAAIPYKNGVIQEIEKYELVERRFIE